MTPRYKRNQIIALVLVVTLGAIAALMWQCYIPGVKFCAKSEDVPTTAPITLEFWNVFEDTDVYQPLIDQFEASRPNVTIVYRKKLFSSYERDLENAFAPGGGPDIFAIHNTWLPIQKSNIAPIPSLQFTLAQLREDFPDVVQFDFVNEGNIYALPLFVDTLALFYNSAYFENTNLLSPPETWDEFTEYVQILRTTNDIGKIDLAGAAIGTAGNINRSTDILGLLMLQTGARMTNDSRTRATFDDLVFRDGVQFEPGKDALEFYTSFADPVSEFYTWNNNMPNSIDAFSNGDAAMMFSYSYTIPVLRRTNRYLEFAVAPAPHPTDQQEQISYANYWGLTVSQNSPNVELAWEFILFLLEEENAKEYLQKVERPTSLKKLIFWQESVLAGEGNTTLLPFVDQILSARSWYQGDSTQTERAIMKMIDGVVDGTLEIEEALRSVAQEVTTFIQEIQ